MKTPIILQPDEGKTLVAGNSKMIFKLLSEQSENKFLVTEYELVAHFPGPPPHKHKVFEHVWYVLDGQVTVQLNHQEITIQKGGFVYVPNKTVHTFSNNMGETARLLAIDTPGGFEKYYEDLQSAFSGGTALDPAIIREIQLKYDTYPPDHSFE